MGDQLLVKVISVEGNKVRLSRKAVLRDQRAKTGAKPEPAEPGEHAPSILSIILPTESTRAEEVSRKVEPFSIGAGFAMRDRRFCLDELAHSLGISPSLHSNSGE